MIVPARMGLLTSALMLIALALAGCVTVRLEQQVTDFASAVADARFAIGASLNAYERRMYLDEALFDPSVDIADVKDGDGTSRYSSS